MGSAHNMFYPIKDQHCWIRYEIYHISTTLYCTNRPNRAQAPDISVVPLSSRVSSWTNLLGPLFVSDTALNSTLLPGSCPLRSSIMYWWTVIWSITCLVGLLIRSILRGYFFRFCALFQLINGTTRHELLYSLICFLYEQQHREKWWSITNSGPKTLTGNFTWNLHIRHINTWAKWFL